MIQQDFFYKTIPIIKQSHSKKKEINSYLINRQIQPLLYRLFHCYLLK